MTSSHKLPAAFQIGIASVALLFLAMMLATARQESFTRDDFAFLAYVQRPHWSWQEVYLPFQERWWWAYRPLGMQTFFYGCFQLFGLDAFGYFVTAITVHFATGWVAFRLMLRLAFAPEVAAATALLTITRFPAANDIFYGSVFHYTAAILLTLLAMNLFIDFARSGDRSKAAGAVVCIFLGLLCNEFVIIYPVFFVFLSLYCDAGESGGPRISLPAIKRAISRALPHLVVALAYWYFRFHLIAEVATNSAYAQSLKPWLIRRNSGRLLYLFFGDIETLVGFALLVAASLCLVLWGRAGGRVGDWWLRTAALCGVWIIGLLAPFAILMVSHARFVKPLEVPLCILLAVLLQLVWRIHAERHKRALQFALIAVTLVALPYQTLWERYHEPLGAYPLALAEAVRAHSPAIGVGSSLVLLYNAPGLASHAGGEKFKRFSFGGTAALQAYFQDRQLTLKLHNLWKRPVEPGCGDCVYLQLLPKLAVVPAEEQFITYQPPYPEKRESPWPRREDREH